MLNSPRLNLKISEGNGIRHINSSSFHPATNGLAERFIQTFKQALKSAKATEMTINKHLNTFLLAYRKASQSTTSATPATLLCGRPLRSRLDLLKPRCEVRVHNQQTDHVITRAGTDREFKQGDSVLIRDFRPNQDKWANAEIKSCSGPVSYQVDTTAGKTWRRHVDHIVRGPSVDSSKPQPSNVHKQISLDPAVTPTSAHPVQESIDTGNPVALATPESRRSGRRVNKPERLIEVKEWFSIVCIVSILRLRLLYYLLFFLNKCSQSLYTSNIVYICMMSIFHLWTSCSLFCVHLPTFNTSLGECCVCNVETWL